MCVNNLDFGKVGKEGLVFFLKFILDYKVKVFFNLNKIRIEIVILKIWK